MKNSEIRKHYFMERYTLFAPRRDLRPKKLSPEQLKKKKMTSEECFFCPQNLDKECSVIYKVGGEGKDWKMAIIQNKFAALSFDNPKAYGTQEVLIETPEHNKDLSDFPLDHIVEILKIYDKRISELSSIEGIKYVLVFKNDGGKAGASIPHSHSQIIALPLIPPKISRESEAADDYYLKHNTCPFCDIIKKEENSPRVVYKDENIIAFCPYSSTSTYGVWITTTNHRRTLGELSDAELKSLAKAVKKVIGKLDLHDISYNYFVSNSLEAESHHFKMKIIPRINIWAGLELSTSIVINTVFPEDAATFYNK